MNKNKNVYVILGGPNSSSGELSSVSIDRVNYCVDNYQKDSLILCTGGWGTHFNTTKNSHASILKESLIAKEIPDTAFLKFALSSNTVDDAVKIKQVLSELESPNLTIITSDYHTDRVKLIFETILESYNMKIIGVKNNLDSSELKKRVAHEKKAIASILKNGLYY
jgi:uncharacterized SAM-binding protein YcdF (DUF218 family)